jgi:predicted phosphodiesterase
MRIAAISDIHGNLPALEAVLADIRKRGVDVTVVLGDLVSGPLWPRETAQLLMEQGAPTIRGNHERQMLDCAHTPGAHSDQYAYEQLTEAQRAWARALPATLRWSDDIFLCHANPDEDLTYLLEDPHTDGLLLPAEEIRRLCGAVQSGLILCGHSHLPWIVRLQNGPTIVNDGSVGLPAYDADLPGPHVHETGSPHARYAMVEGQGERWQAALHTVVYDWDAAIARARANGREDWARWLRGRVAL